MFPFSNAGCAFLREIGEYLFSIFIFKLPSSVRIELSLLAFFSAARTVRDDGCTNEQEERRATMQRLKTLLLMRILSDI